MLVNTIAPHQIQRRQKKHWWLGRWELPTEVIYWSNLDHKLVKKHENMQTGIEGKESLDSACVWNLTKWLQNVDKNNNGNKSNITNYTKFSQA